MSEPLHQFARKAGGGIAGRYHSDLFHSAKLYFKTVENIKIWVKEIIDLISGKVFSSAVQSLRPFHWDNNDPSRNGYLLFQVF